MLKISKILCLLQSSCLLCRKWKHNQLFMGYYVAAGLPGRWHLQILKKCFMKQRILSQGLHNCSLMAYMLPTYILYEYCISYVYTLSIKFPYYTFIQYSFLTAILHRGLRNCFFFRSQLFSHILFGLLFPFSIWTFILFKFILKSF